MSISKQLAVKRAPKKVASHRPAAPKVFDVARPGKTPASSTSKPVIITNRPVMQDPMVVAAAETQPVAAEQPTTAPVLKPATKLVIKPLHDHVAPEPTPEVLPPAAEATENTSDSPSEPSLDEAIQAATSQQTAAATEPEPTAQPAPEPETIDFSQTAPGVPTQNPLVADDQIKPLPQADRPVIADVAVPVKTDVQLTPGDSDAVALAAQKRAVELRQIIDRQQYFLPINTVENKRNKRIAVAGLVLIILLAGAWYDTALDAGLLTNTYNLPHSHFFSK